MWSVVSVLLCFIFCHHQLVTAKLRKLNINDQLVIEGLRNRIFNLAEVIRKCSRSVEDINECICESIELLRNNLANGDFGDNFTIPRIEPLFIEEININRQNYNEMVFTNLFVSGPSQFVLKNMR